jgi:Flp pilus assembly protein TadD
MTLYAEILINEGKNSKAFQMLNHAIKFDYKNSMYWSDLGTFYES